MLSAMPCWLISGTAILLWLSRLILGITATDINGIHTDGHVNNSTHSESATSEGDSERVINGAVVSSRPTFNYLARIDIDFQQVIVPSFPVPNPVRYFCAGALISVNFVLTAAQCVVQKSTGALPSRIQVALGDLNYKYTESGEQFSDASSTIHPDFNRNTLANDIAVLRLKTPAILTANIGTIAVERNALTNYDGIAVVFAGWGKYTQVSLTKYSPELRSAPATVVNTDTCRTRWNSASGQTAAARILSTNICYSGDNTDNPCYGDAGGPVVREVTVAGVTTRTVIGINSDHLNRYLDQTTQLILQEVCRTDVPAAGTRVGAYFASFVQPNTDLV